MAQAGYAHAKELLLLLSDKGVALGERQMNRIISGDSPQRIIAVVGALCEILNCTPNELIQRRVPPRKRGGRKPPPDGPVPGTPPPPMRALRAVDR